MSHLPDFLVIGVGKAGTHSVFEYLRQHPLISLTKMKETSFFVCDAATIPGPKEYKGQLFTNSINNLEDYLNEFDQKKTATIFGEVCPSYYFYPNAPLNIKHYIPDVKIICILRNPADRLFSNFMYGSEENNLSLFIDMVNRISVLKDTDTKFSRWVENGFFYEHLINYYSIFPRENIKIFLYEELVNDPNKLMNDILNFIGLPEYQFNTALRFNISGKVRFRWFKSLIKKYNISSSLRNHLPVKTYQRIRFITEKILFVKKDRMPLVTRRILQDLYREDILKLEKLIDKDLSHWLQ